MFKTKSAKRLAEPIPLYDARQLLDRLGAATVTVARSSNRDATGTSTYYYSPAGRITLHRSAGPWVVVHEAAHHFARFSGEVEPGHGPVFRREYLRLVNEAFGERWALRLRKAFDRYGLTVAATITPKAAESLPNASR